MMGGGGGGAAGRSSNFGAGDVYGMSASRGPTPRPSNYDEDGAIKAAGATRFGVNNTASSQNYPAPNPGMFSPTGSKNNPKIGNANSKANGNAAMVNQKSGNMNNDQDGNRDLHMFVWSSSASPVSDVFGSHEYGTGHDQKDVRLAVSPGKGTSNFYFLFIFFTISVFWF